ncbi:hypothetical protein [Tenacibaculum retecalamus]|uniref:hypothetical protein n=1 Tax=Tenacibaculum retecalamus TaxID=3018315 RepID=UPI0023D96D8F|nr:hypothetical protein [Tenacibaculum retecalamus]WBX71336.1 hypothetical protein PG912_00575 [Tenacibaculum retecalamus]
MELTNEQVQRIDKYLDVKGVKFIDFRIEIMDHIISQIEKKLESENTDFETVFYQVTDDWNKQLNNTTSWLFGFAYPAPKIVIKKAKKVFTTYFILSFLPLFIAFLIVLKSKMMLNEVLGYLTVALTIVLLIVSSFYTFKIWKSKEKTVYNFIIKTQLLNFLVMPLIIIGNSIIDFINVGILGYMIVTTYAVRLFYIKHQQEKERYKLLVK